MKVKRPPTSIPKEFQKYFWDVDVAKLDPSQNSAFVIQRLLDKGDDKAVLWVNSNFSEEEIKAVFKKMRDFSPKIGQFWSAFLQIPVSEMACLQTPYQTMRKNRWPF